MLMTVKTRHHSFALKFKKLMRAWGNSAAQQPEFRVYLTIL